MFVGDPSEGINARPRHSHRAMTCDNLLKLIDKFGFMVLRGPPRSGKTSLLQLIRRRVVEVRKQCELFSSCLCLPQHCLKLQAIQTPFSRNVTFVNCAGVTTGSSWSDLFKHRTGLDWVKVSSISGMKPYTAVFPIGPCSKDHLCTQVVAHLLCSQGSF